ncbi:MAG: barstar family protein [Betaproteobacteria bacterium]|jgi:hypothetical protein
MKTDFHALIASCTGGVFRCHSPLPDAALESAARAALRIVPIRLNPVRDKNAFLNALAAALEFPAHFGHNWDAFYDCLLDPVRGEGGGTLLVLREASGFARADPDEFAAAMDTLADAADYWNGAGKALLTVVELETPALAPGLAEISCPAN